MPSIAHIAFDLPLEGPFDYLVPDEFSRTIKVGMRVMVPFGSRQACGFVVALADKSDIAKLKPIKTLCETHPLLNAWQMKLAEQFARHYGCSLGQALAAMLPQLLREGRKVETTQILPAQPLPQVPSPTVIVAPSGDYAGLIRGPIERMLKNKRSVLVLVPDVFALNRIKVTLKKDFEGVDILIDDAPTLKGRTEHWLKVRRLKEGIVLGTRSTVFAPLNDMGLSVMIDEADTSYKQEQTPLYETRDVLLMRSRCQGAAVVFCSVSPSVDVWHHIKQGDFQCAHAPAAEAMTVQAVDLSNYKFVPGMLSPPLRNNLDAALKIKERGMLVLNRRGSYNVTRCIDCGHTLKCRDCDSLLVYSRAAKKFLCRHCSYDLPGETKCPQCRKSNWKSFGIGVEQMQTELKKYFPQAAIATFERDSVDIPKNFDILITTQAVLRFQDSLKVSVVACVDFDAELNRMDVHSSFKAWSLVRHLSTMTNNQVILQSRNVDHYVIKALIRNDPDYFYTQELQLRKEMGFSPFKHWVQITARAKIEASALECVSLFYKELLKTTDKTYVLTQPKADGMARKRGQYRFNVMVQGDDIVVTMDVVKAALAKVKRPSRVIVTLNVDP